MHSIPALHVCDNMAGLPDCLQLLSAATSTTPKECAQLLFLCRKITRVCLFVGVAALVRTSGYSCRKGVVCCHG